METIAEQHKPPRFDTTLADKYSLSEGLVFMSGTQALVRLPIQQRIRDRMAGLKTAGFISGYRGSPLGRYDMELWRVGTQLAAHDVRFQPGVNEDLAATAVWGSQYVPLLPRPKFDGVFGIWYGKGPGVDRSGDVLKHANAAGTSPLGGVIAVAGDDHGAKSSTQAHQSDQAFVSAGMPVLYPSDVQEILDFGLHGIAMSRHAGCWVGLKLVTEVVEGSGTVLVSPDSPSIVLPEHPDGASDVHIKRFEMPAQQEVRLYQRRLPASLAYARANGLNRIVNEAPNARIGIVSAGKSWADTRQAMQRLGLPSSPAGIRLLKVGMVWPLDPGIVVAFARGLDTILVVEEKRPLIEDQLKSILFDAGPGLGHPRVVGKFDGSSAWAPSAGAPVLSMVGELNPAVIAERIAALPGVATLLPAGTPAAVVAHPVTRPVDLPLVSDRTPTFCSGCPHSTSTRVPEGSLALAGIGCHGMAILLYPDRTGPMSHMGGEGAMWVGQSPFTDEPHVFANIGDGTYYHSGFLAIRQAVAAKVSITYKLLLNGFVSMTGGQPIEGELTPAQVAAELHAEGVARVVIVTDDPAKYEGRPLPANVPVHHRERLDAVQKELREQAGVSVLIYDQMCATERRRQRKRGTIADTSVRTFINAAVCEGCGDCGEQSNCLSVEPLDTEFGRKRRINQASCNRDLSCVQGFCPSFVTLKGAALRKTKTPAGATPDLSCLAEPAIPPLDTAQGLIVAGVGGTGVVTVSAVLGMAVHLDGNHVTTLDLTGLAQKYGAVMSHIRIARDRDQLNTYRLASAAADVMIGCDLIVAAGSEAFDRMKPGHTQVIVNTDFTPTREFFRNPDWKVDAEALVARMAERAAQVEPIAATRIAQDLLGDPVGANMFMLGYAWQRGWVGVSRAAIERAIELNAVAVPFNLNSFNWGRIAAHDPQQLQRALSAVSGGRRQEAPKLERLADIVAHRSGELKAWQSVAFADRYRRLVERIAGAERIVTPGIGDQGGRERLAMTVARYYYKLLAYKDEFEVARLYSSPTFREELERTFEGDFELRFHLGAGPFARHVEGSDKPRKREVGGWILSAFAVLSKLRFLRGSLLDPFRNSAERKHALASIASYEADMKRIAAELDADRLDLAIEIASWPEHLRGFGHVRLAHEARVAGMRTELWQRWERSAKENAR